jgi:hypothetical protein
MYIDINDKIFLIQDKINMMEMILEHTRLEILELRNLALKLEKLELDKKFAHL